MTDLSITPHVLFAQGTTRVNWQMIDPNKSQVSAQLLACQKLIYYLNIIRLKNYKKK